MYNIDDLPKPQTGKTGWPWTIGNLKSSSNPSKDYPKITIVTPSYNQANYLENTIRSVLLQNYPNLEYFVIDGNSKDGSLEIIRKYEQWIDYWVSEPDRCQVHAITKGAERANSEIFSWLNSDDFLLPGALSSIARLYQQHPDSIAWVGGCFRIRPDGLILSRVIPRNLDQDSLIDWWWQGFFFQPSLYFATRAWKELNSMDESLHIAFDVDWFVQLANWGKYTSTSEMLSAAIIHPKAKTQALKKTMQNELSIVQMRYSNQDYQKFTNNWFIRSLKFPLVRKQVLKALGEILVSRMRLYGPWEWKQYPRYLQTEIARMNT